MLFCERKQHGSQFDRQRGVQFSHRHLGYHPPADELHPAPFRGLGKLPEFLGG
jgi:hypothetical protein